MGTHEVLGLELLFLSRLWSNSLPMTMNRQEGRHNDWRLCCWAGCRKDGYVFLDTRDRQKAAIRCPFFSCTISVLLLITAVGCRPTVEYSNPQQRCCGFKFLCYTRSKEMFLYKAKCYQRALTRNRSEHSCVILSLRIPELFDPWGVNLQEALMRNCGQGKARRPNMPTLRDLTFSSACRCQFLGVPFWSHLGVLAVFWCMQCMAWGRLWR